MKKVTVRIPTSGCIDATVIAPEDATAKEVAQLVIGHGVSLAPNRDMYPGGAYFSELDAEAIGPEFTREQLDELRSK